MPFSINLPAGRRNQTQLSNTRFGNLSEYLLRLIDLKFYFTVVSLKDVGLTTSYKMTSNLGCSESGTYLVWAGSLPGNMSGCWQTCHGSLVVDHFKSLLIPVILKLQHYSLKNHQCYIVELVPVDLLSKPHAQSQNDHQPWVITQRPATQPTSAPAHKGASSCPFKWCTISLFFIPRTSISWIRLQTLWCIVNVPCFVVSSNPGAATYLT